MSRGNAMRRIQVGRSKIGIKDVYTIVDDIDYEACRQYTWHLSSHGYASTKLKSDINLYLHQLIITRIVLSIPKGHDIDHKDRDRLNNRRDNLRIITHRQNLINSDLRRDNTSGVTGVYWNKDRNKYQSHIRINGKTINLGRFNKFEDAVAARLKAEEKYFPGIRIK